MPLIAVIADMHFDNWARWAADPLTAEGLDILISQREPDLLVVAGDLSTASRLTDWVILLNPPRYWKPLQS